MLSSGSHRFVPSRLVEDAKNIVGLRLVVVRKQSCHEFPSARDVNLLEDRLHVVAHGVGREVKLPCNLRSAGAPGNKSNHLLLAIGQVVGLHDDWRNVARFRRLDYNRRISERVVRVTKGRCVAHQPSASPSAKARPRRPVADGPVDGARPDHKRLDPDRNGETVIARVAHFARHFGQPHPGVSVGYQPTELCVEEADIGGMGYHYVHPGFAADSAIDPTLPEVLLYAPNRRGELRLVGIEYVKNDVDGDLGTDDDRPSLFGEPFHGPMEGHEPGQPVHYDIHAWVWKSIRRANLPSSIHTFDARGTDVCGASSTLCRHSRGNLPSTRSERSVRLGEFGEQADGPVDIVGGVVEVR
jgi:hypothetical protein